MALKSQYQIAIVNQEPKQTVSFLAGQDTSEELNCGGTAPIAIDFPSNFTACEVTFMVRNYPNDDLKELTNFDGSAYAIAADALKRVPLQASQFCSVIYVQLLCSVAQAEDCAAEFVLGPLFQGIHG